VTGSGPAGETTFADIRGMLRRVAEGFAAADAGHDDEAQTVAADRVGQVGAEEAGTDAVDS